VGLYTELFYAIIPTLFLCFLLICYPYILSHFIAFYSRLLYDHVASSIVGSSSIIQWSCNLPPWNGLPQLWHYRFHPNNELRSALFCPPSALLFGFNRKRAVSNSQCCLW